MWNRRSNRPCVAPCRIRVRFFVRVPNWIFGGIKKKAMERTERFFFVFSRGIGFAMQWMVHTTTVVEYGHFQQKRKSSQIKFPWIGATTSRLKLIVRGSSNQVGLRVAIRFSWLWCISVQI